MPKKNGLIVDSFQFGSKNNSSPEISLYISTLKFEKNSLPVSLENPSVHGVIVDGSWLCVVFLKFVIITENLELIL